MYELKNIGKVFTSKSLGTGPSSYEKRIYRAAVWQRVRDIALMQHGIHVAMDFCQNPCEEDNELSGSVKL